MVRTLTAGKDAVQSYGGVTEKRQHQDDQQIEAGELLGARQLLQKVSELARQGRGESSQPTLLAISLAGMLVTIGPRGWAFVAGLQSALTLVLMVAYITISTNAVIRC